MSTYQESLDQRTYEDIFDSAYPLLRNNPRTWQSVCAACGILGGLLSPVIGTLLLAIRWCLQPGTLSSILNVLSIVSFTLTIPLLALGAHCLDRLETKALPALATGSESGPRGVRAHSYSSTQGNGLRPTFIAMAVGMALLFILPTTVKAQQTIFSVPTTDVLDKGKVYFELDVPFKTNSDPGNVVPAFSSFVPRIVVGAGGGVEVGLNIAGNINPGPDSTTLVPTIKYKAYDGGQNGWAIVIGDNLFIPVRNKSYDIGNYIYAQASKTFSTKTRVTFGGYHFSDNVVAAGAQRAGGQFGFEHPVTDTFAFAADWYTGKHAAGYFTPGVIFKPGNADLSRGNHFFLLELGYNFN